jgi:micrococcal nuclease
VYRATDGLFVNLELTRDGFAVTLSIAPNVAHADEFAAAAAEARRAGRGLWSACR